MSNHLEIRRLNDSFRGSLSDGGKRLMTAGIAALPYRDQVAILLKAIQALFDGDRAAHAFLDHAKARVLRVRRPLKK